MGIHDRHEAGIDRQRMRDDDDHEAAIEERMRRKIYVASSWRNKHQPGLVTHLRQLGHEVYDFRNPPHGDKGFAWSDIDPNWMKWTPAEWREALTHPLAVDGFASDRMGMEWADLCVLVLPSGRSSHLEAGWMVGKGKPCAVYAPESVEPDLMVGLCDVLVTSEEELEAWLVEIASEKPNAR